MIDALGYVALCAGLFAISRKKIVSLRWWHLTSSILYVGYGIIISSNPVAFGATLYAGIHIFHLIRLHNQKVLNIKR